MIGKLRKWLKSVLIALNVLTVVAYLLSSYASTINPDHSWAFAFVGVIFPLLLILNFAWILFWLFTKRVWVLISLVAITLTWNDVSKNIAFNFTQPQPSENELKLMTWNVQNFDLYNWSRNRESRDTMLAMIKRADPDILCIQEFYTEDYGVSQNINQIKKLGLKYFYFEPTLRLRNRDNWGIVIFSKYPIIHSNLIKFDNSKFNLAIYSDIEIDKKIVRVYNLHLQSIHFGSSDYKYFEQPETPSEDNLPSIRRIASKMKTAFQKRGVQADQVKQIVEDNQVPAIICGDFNDTPNSYAYETLSSGMTDAFTSAGNGVGSTYTGPIPFVRTDYVLMSDDLEVKDYEVIKREVSDHFPVVVVFGY